ncbi:uncharacterized protein N7484_001292 [Penicillium longicatenatum]|uniref:uncharacterized protein n=1 Tax=Penicillium longicatenatum TaxID=1561947 RepID=UPI002546A5C3|nr:uncharacterized protein N7484_001292 [Penicillium longicatenatum]KAJ5657643.1 hypothetical protein N7484_001292 [Penicillium longicatenatum]
MVPELDRRPEDGECEFEGFSDEDEDEMEVEFMSQYSRSAESSDLENDSDVEESDSPSDNESDYIASTVPAEIPDSNIITPANDEHFVPDHTGISSSSHSCCQETEFWFLKSDSLDYCLVEVDEDEPYLQDLPILCRENIGQLGSESVDVTAATCSGNILTGVLSPYLSLIRLPNATRYTNILSVRFEGCLQQGDSGSMVRDARTGMIYGHIIAGDPGSKVAFIVPAVDVFNDAMEKFTHIDEASVKCHARKWTDQAESTKSRWENPELSIQKFWKFPSYRENSIPDGSTIHLRRVPCFSLPRPREGYATAVAAAYAKESHSVVPIDQVNDTTMARDPLEDSVHRFNVPLDLTAVPTVESFVRRQDELKHLWQYLQPVDPQSRKVAVLHGLGGIGKTQLAIRFARDHKHDFTAIFWLNGKDRVTLLQSLSSNLSRLPGKSQNKEAINEEEVKKRAREVLQWLALEGNSRWLVIFDNIDQYSSDNNSAADETYDTGDFFPIADHGSILITSRLQESTELGKSFMPQTGTSAIEYLHCYQASDPDIAALDNNSLHIRKAPDFSLPKPREYQTWEPVGGYTVGWICSLDTEYAAAGAMLDEGEDYPSSYQTHKSTSYSRTKDRKWVLDQSELQAWKSKPDSNLLWLRGNPGAEYLYEGEN